MTTAIPTKIQSVWISNFGLGYTGTSKLQMCGTSVSEPLGVVSSAYAFSETGELKIALTRLEATTVSKQQDSPVVDSTRQLCYSIDWKPDITLMTPEETLSLYKTDKHEDITELKFYQDLDLVIYSYTMKTLKEVNESEIEQAKPHLQKHVAALRQHVERFKAQHILASPDQLELYEDTESLEKLANSIEIASPMGKLHVTVARNLSSIIRGMVDPLELIFSNSSFAEEYYRAVFHMGSYCKDAAKYLDGLAHQNPAMKILEIGAGTGGFTDVLLPTLLRHEEMDSISPRFSSYDYTDITGAFMEKASDRIGSLSEKIEFKVLDIEARPADQGFELQTYDLIIAGSVSFPLKPYGGSQFHFAKLYWKVLLRLTSCRFSTQQAA